MTDSHKTSGGDSNADAVLRVRLQAWQSFRGALFGTCHRPLWHIYLINPYLGADAFFELGPMALPL